MNNSSVNLIKCFLAFAFAGMMAFSLTACDEGPAEEAGEELDEISSDVGNVIEDACEELKEGANAENPNC